MDDLREQIDTLDARIEIRQIREASMQQCEASRSCVVAVTRKSTKASASRVVVLIRHDYVPVDVRFRTVHHQNSSAKIAVLVGHLACSIW